MDFKAELAVTRDNLDNYLAEKPHGAAAFAKLQKAAMDDGALSLKTKELIALAIGIARQCSDCIGFHTQAAVKAGASKEEIAETVDRLADRIYLVAPVRKYVLLRLDELLANQPGVSYQHKMITVEHVLPQNPSAGSQWTKDFTDEDRAQWTHRLGNLVLLNRAKNSEAQNYDFAKKKANYFGGAHGSAVFALTTQVLAEEEWTPDVVQRRHDDLLSVLHKEWELN